MSVLTTVLYMLRREKRWTQLQLAQMCGITQGEISRMESGRRARNIELVAAYLDIDNPDDLLIHWDDYRDRQRERQLIAVGA